MKLARNMLMTAALCAPLSAQAVDLQLGPGLIYGSDVEEFGLQFNLYAGIESVVGLRAGFDANFWLVDNIDVLSFNVNGHYMVFEQEPMAVYALAGLNYFRVSYNLLGYKDANGEMGVNLGAGGQFETGPGLFFGEVKYVLGDADQFVIGLGYRFSVM